MPNDFIVASILSLPNCCMFVDVLDHDPITSPGSLADCVLTFLRTLPARLAGYGRTYIAYAQKCQALFAMQYNTPSGRQLNAIGNRALPLVF